MKLSNGRCLLQPLPQVVMQIDASKTGWGATCKGVRTGGAWSKEEQKLHINILELLAVKLALITKLKISPFSDRQYNSIVISPKNGRNKESCLDTAEQGHMVYITNQGDHNYCRIPTYPVY